MKQVLFSVILLSAGFFSGWFSRGATRSSTEQGQDRLRGLTASELFKLFGHPATRGLANSTQQDDWIYGGMVVKLDARDINGKDPLGHPDRLVSRILVFQNLDGRDGQRLNELAGASDTKYREIDLLRLTGDGAK